MDAPSLAPPAGSSGNGVGVVPLSYPARPHRTADPVAYRRAMVEYRWRCAHADYLIGCEAGALSIGEDWRQIIARIYAAYVIADAQE